MRQATLSVEIVTPCFLRGSETGGAEWRGPSIRGQLRWWFRALAGGRLLDLPTAAERLERVRRWEAALFGDTRTRSPLAVVPMDAPATIGPGPLRSDLRKRLGAEELAEAWGIGPGHADRANTVDRLTVRRNGNAVATNPFLYLGYGCLAYVRGEGETLARACIAPGEVARVDLRWRDATWGRVPAEAAALLQPALWAWIHLGGLGSRSRNGFGALALRGVEGDLPGGEEPHLAPATSRAALQAGFRALVAAACGGGADAEWTSVTRDSRLLVGATKRTWNDALALAGAWLIAYRRRYGAPSDARARNGTPLANRDYEWAYKGTGEGVPDRAGFGLPLPFGERRPVVTWGTPRPDERFADQRRASPLLVSVVRLDRGFAPVFTHLPSRFLPDGAELGFKDRTTPRQAPDRSLQLSIVDDFLDDLLSRKLAEELR